MKDETVKAAENLRQFTIALAESLRLLKKYQAEVTLAK